MKEWAWLIPLFKYNFNGKRQPARNLSFVASCPSDLIQSPWLCMSFPYHDSQVYISSFNLVPTVILACYKATAIFTWTSGQRWLTTQYPCTSLRSIVVSSTWPRTTFPAVHPRRWHVTRLFPVHLPHVLFAPSVGYNPREGWSHKMEGAWVLESPRGRSSPNKNICIALSHEWEINLF